jgi:hypothetical protein
MKSLNTLSNYQVDTKQQKLLPETKQEIPYGYHDLVNEALKNKNFKLAEILLNKISFNAIFESRWNNEVNWFLNKEVFNFLFERARKSGKIDKIRIFLSGKSNLARVCEHANLSQFKLIAQKTNRSYWFLKDSSCLTEAIINNNYPILKELIKIAKSLYKSSADNIIKNHIKIYSIYRWFFSDEADLRSLKLIMQELPEINLASPILNQLIQSILESATYQNKDKKIINSFKKLTRFFKLKVLSFYPVIKLLQKIMFDPTLFFFVYKRVNQKDYVINSSGLLELIQFEDKYQEIHPKIAKFLLKKNLQILSAQTNNQSTI